MSSKWMISRRTMLKGVGATIALPMLDAMAPAGGVSRIASAAAATPAAAPLRMAAIFMPNGVSVPNWKVTGEGSDFELSPTLKPLEGIREQLNVLSGLSLDNARAKGDGPGDHARSAAAFLTGVHPYKTAGKDIHLGVSVDQMAAEKVGGATRFPSLELGLDKGGVAGECDSGYSCAYTSNISWRTDTTPMPHEVDPGQLFDRLFGSQDERAALESRTRRLRDRKSILDFVLSDTRRLNSRLGRSDQQKLDEFTTSIREVEKRVEVARTQKSDGPKPEMARPDGIPADFAEHMKLMFDLLALAFRMDVTRISTVMVAREGSNRSYPEIGVTDGHHSVSHHGHDEQKLEAIRKIDLFHMEQIARFLQKLKDTKEGEGNLLDNSMIVIGSGIGDGDRHNHNDLPILLAGRAGGKFTAGRHVAYPNNTPLCNLYVSMLETMGAKMDRFGDSTGALEGLTA